MSRSFLTVRLQPSTRIEFDLNHTYFRDIPTYNAALIDTGLLDKYLFQGFSGGVRVQVVKDVWAYNLLGRSNRSGDTKASWNQLYGVTVGRMPWIRTRTDVHYSKFTSSFRKWILHIRFHYRGTSTTTCGGKYWVDGNPSRPQRPGTSHTS